LISQSNPHPRALIVGVRKDILRVMEEKMVVILDPDDEKG
jgi:hypothetical protein